MITKLKEILILIKEDLIYNEYRTKNT